VSGFKGIEAEAIPLYRCGTAAGPYLPVSLFHFSNALKNML